MRMMPLAQPGERAWPRCSTIRERVLRECLAPLGRASAARSAQPSAVLEPAPALQEEDRLGPKAREWLEALGLSSLLPRPAYL